MTDEEKTELGLRTFEEFFKQFGQDTYAEILLEELLKGLIYEETLFIFGEQIEDGDQIIDGLAERIDSNVPADGSINTGSSTDFRATPDLPDYP